MFQSLQNHLQLSHAKEMGYHDEEKFAQALNAFKSKNTLIDLKVYVLHKPFLQSERM